MTKAKRGFTLVEVILAIIIFTIGAGSLMEIVFTINRGLMQVEIQHTHEADVRFVRRQVMAITDRDILEEGDEIETLNSGTASWVAEIVETEVLDLFKLTITITFNTESTTETEPHIDELYVLRQGSSWMEPVDRSTLLDDKRERILQERGAVN